MDWGIFKGFSSNRQLMDNWQSPVCPTCSRGLKPWIDWIYHGSVGYCEDCENICLVKTTSKPSLNNHPKIEIDEFVSHEYHKIEFDSGLMSPRQLWNYYKNIPTTYENICILNEERKKLENYNNEESKLLGHLIWRLIFNSEHFDKELFVEYLRFAMQYPHFYNMYEKYEVWLGYEIDLANTLEKLYKDEIYESIYEIWQLFGNSRSNLNYKSAIGIFVLPDYILYKKFEPEFDEFLSKIIVRKF